MNTFVKRLREERGLTLVELIATLSIMSMVMGTIYGVITFGFNAYHRVNIENQLRDEADVVMSMIITEMYSFGPERLEEARNRTNNVTGIKLVRTGAEQAPEYRYILMIPKDTSSNPEYNLYIGENSEGSEEEKEHLGSTLRGTPGQLPIQLSCSREKERKETAGDSCTSGLVNVKLELGRDNRGREQTLKLESTFGF